MDIRIGYGWDSHAFKPGVPLKIGGLSIDHPEGLAGHSDGDVLLHAITDALLGAVSAGDIGSFFPPGDPRWKDADSAIFLELGDGGNSERRLSHRECGHDAGAKCSEDRADFERDAGARGGVTGHSCRTNVGIKAKTPEGLDADHVAQAHAVVLLERIEEPGELQTMTAVMQSQRELEDVVRDLVSQVHGVPVKAPFDTDDIT